jgi:malate synthase
LEEAHILINGEPMSASLFDFGLFFFHNATESVKIAQGPYFYLPKMEHYLEARLWNDVFNASQDYLRLPRGTIRATVLIETILGAFHMEEIIFELRQHSSGLNCGRWDYIFSVIKKFGKFREFILPDRKEVTMEVSFMQAYVARLIHICHKRGVHAMGGMAAQIPIKGDDRANEEAMGKVRRDKRREVLAGHDGTWVAHPALVSLAKGIFDEYMPGPNQLHQPLFESFADDAASALIKCHIPGGKVTLQGVNENIEAALQYIAAWLTKNGCVPINHLMEDAATAEIARTQLWQWLYHGVPVSLPDGTFKKMKASWFESLLAERLAALKKVPQLSTLDKSADVLQALVVVQDCPDFLTLHCYPLICSLPSSAKL